MEKYLKINLLKDLWVVIMDITTLPRKYNIFEGLSRTRKDEEKFISQLKPIHKRIYDVLHKSIRIGIFLFLILLILLIFFRNPFITYFLLIVAITNILLSITRQRIRMYIKNKIKKRKY